MKSLTVEQAAKELGVTKRVIYYAIATNRIKAKKIADVYWIEPRELNKLRKK